jgi:hypothetical protein
MCFSSSAETDTTMTREDTTANVSPPVSDLSATKNTTTSINHEMAEGMEKMPDNVDPSPLAAVLEETR